MNYDLFYEIINKNPIFAYMKTVREDSPYHRESSVFEHTMMVCQEFDDRYSVLDDDYFVGLFACLFHDIGKPACRTPKESESRGKYFTYEGHDMESSEQAVEIMARYHEFSPFNIIRIKWMIEHHSTFWTIKDNDKKVELANDFRNAGLGLNYHCFKTFMIADDMGRICEDRTQDSNQIFKDFEEQYLH